MRLWYERRKLKCPAVFLHWDNTIAGEIAMLGLNESPFVDAVLSLLQQEHSRESVRNGLNRARGALASKTVRTATERETKKQRDKSKREAEIHSKAQRSRRTGRRR